MKKRIVKIVSLLGVMALLATGCVTDQVSNEYITINKYKGVEVPAVEGIPEITDESVDNNIETVLEGFSKLYEVDRAAAEGDVVVLDYTSTENGEAIENGSIEGYELEIGSGTFFDELENSLIGHVKGDVYDLEHTFADDYGMETFAGKDVVFTVTVQSVNEKEVPELTDEFVQTVSQESDTVEEYREEMRALLEENNEEYILGELEETAWQEVLDKTEVTEYPEDKLEAEKQSFYDHYEAGAELYGMEFGEFLAQMEMTEDEFEEQVTEASESNVKENLVAELIAEKEGIEISDEEYEEEKEALATEQGYTDVAEMEEEVEEEYIRSYILRDKVKRWVADNCIQVKE